MTGNGSAAMLRAPEIPTHGSDNDRVSGAAGKRYPQYRAMQLDDLPVIAPALRGDAGAFAV